MNNKIINLGLDIDGTITAQPEFFAFLSRKVKNEGGKVYIVTSRIYSPEMEKKSIEEVTGHGVVFDEIYFTPNANDEMPLCQLDELNWYEKVLWHKVWFCLEKGVNVFFDDTSLVVSLFREYGGGITIFQVFE